MKFAKLFLLATLFLASCTTPVSPTLTPVPTSTQAPSPTATHTLTPTSTPTITNNLVGVWSFDGEYGEQFMDFTKDGQFFSQGKIGEYQFLDDGTIKVTVSEDGNGEIYETFILNNVNITQTTLNFQPSGEDEYQIVNRVKGYPNLKRDILGTWIGKLESFDVPTSFTFDKNGNFRMEYEKWGNSGHYTILSDNTILINLDDGDFTSAGIVHLFIRDLSNTKFTLIIWESYRDETVFTREK